MCVPNDVVRDGVDDGDDVVVVDDVGYDDDDDDDHLPMTADMWAEKGMVTRTLVVMDVVVVVAVVHDDCGDAGAGIDAGGRALKKQTVTCLWSSWNCSTCCCYWYYCYYSAARAWG